MQSGELKILPGSASTGDEVTTLAFARGGKILAGGTADGAIYVWEAQNTKLLATLMPLPLRRKDSEEDSETPRSRDWIAYTPEGYYNGSPAAATFIRWRVGNQIFPAEKYEATSHRPDRGNQAQSLSQDPGKVLHGQSSGSNTIWKRRCRISL